MRVSGSRRLLITAVALLCVLQSVVGAGIVAGASTDGAGVQLAQSTPTPTNNTTVQQENPDEVDESGDTDAVRSYLAQSLADRLGESAISISQGEYEQGRALLGDEYDSTLSKYVDVEGDTGASESFDQAATSQRELADTAEEYNETYQAYQEARESGNTTRARELARELDRLAGDANESARTLASAYTEIENTTGADLSLAREQMMNTSAALRERHEEVIADTFVRTTLTVRTDDETASFAAPARVQGELTLANGTALANRTVRIQIGERVETVRTDGDGAFRLDYRPVTIPNGTANVSVAYRPAAESVYLGSNATLNVTVVQTTAALSVSTATASAAFGDTVTVSGRAHVDGTPVEGARVRVSVGEVALGTTTTGPNGTYQLTGELPASVSVGTTSVSAKIVPADAAVRSNETTAPLRVEPTETDLSVNATLVDGSDVRIAGQLTTADGTPVAGQTVELRIAGSTVASVETRSDGTFARVVTPQESLSGTVTVQALYQEPSTNLGDARTQDQVNLDAGGNAGESGQSPDENGDGEGWLGETLPFPPELLAGGGVVLLSLLAIGWLVRREDEAPTPEEPTGVAPSTTEAAGSAGGASVGDEASALLAADESEAAIRALYAAVRRSISAGDSSQTHWEFYTAASDGLNPDAAGALERLTAAYERVVYSPNSVDQEQASDILDDAESLFGDGEESV